jgi:hypothetical protein
VGNFRLKKVTSSDGINMSTATEKKNDTRTRIKELQSQVDDLKELVNTLLSVIVEEPDGVHTGSAPTGGHPLANTCM